MIRNPAAPSFRNPPPPAAVAPQDACPTTLRTWVGQFRPAAIQSAHAQTHYVLRGDTGSHFSTAQSKAHYRQNSALHIGPYAKLPDYAGGHPCPIRQPLATGAASLALLTAFFQGATYYFHAVETRASKGEFTWALVLVTLTLWVPAYCFLNLGPATFGCKHWSCVWPHDPPV